jgi:hypothetical protein
MASSFTLNYKILGMSSVFRGIYPPSPVGEGPHNFSAFALAFSFGLACLYTKFFLSHVLKAKITNEEKKEQILKSII